MMRDAFQDAESTPPEGLWERIAAQDIAPRAKALSKTQLARLKLAASALIGTVIGIAITQFFKHVSQDLPNNESIAMEEVKATTPTEATIEAADILEPSSQVETQHAHMGRQSQTETPSGEQSASSPSGHSQLMALPQTAVPAAQPVAQTIATPAPKSNTTIAPTEPKQNEIAKSSVATPSPTLTPSARTTEAQPTIATTETKAPLIQEEPKPEELFIPNLITPNGDGVNDTWRIPLPEGYGTVAVKIFSANSQLVYSNNNYDGSFGGEGCKAGNYFYILTIREKNIVRRGVLIIKDR